MKAKWLFDRFFSFFLLVVVSPIFVIIMIFVAISSKGPIFFIQKRVGQYGRLFNMYKFRTMFLNYGSSISVKFDPRITPIGHFIRKWKLDELPELWNVLIGSMSFVGPRPDVPGYADKLKGGDKQILNLKPGITGPASLKYINEEEILSKVEDPVKYNNEVIYPDKVKINIKYLQKIFFWLDLKIIFFTIIRKKNFRF